VSAPVVSRARVVDKNILKDKIEAIKRALDAKIET